MEQITLMVHLLVAVALIALILLQRGKGADIGPFAALQQNQRNKRDCDQQVNHQRYLFHCSSQLCAGDRPAL